MELEIYQVDAFTSQLFAGNPAAICPLDEWLPDETMQHIAMENNLSETAFFIEKEDGFEIRWFTPNAEVDLCGHATLATAHVIYNHLGYTEDKIKFECKSGVLIVSKAEGGFLMNFPADTIKEVEIPEIIKESLKLDPLTVYEGVSDMMIVINNQQQLQTLNPDLRLLETLGRRGFIVTAPGENVDFVSRCFYPNCDIDEDPVTGSAHTTMAPYWSAQLGKNTLVARQLSRRGGQIHCKLKGDRVELSGQAITYMVGKITVN